MFNAVVRASASSRHSTRFWPGIQSSLKTSIMLPGRARYGTPAALPEQYKEDLSRGPMLRFQDSLPRLPVPTLKETAERYLKSVHPLLTPVEYGRTKAAVEGFIKPGGPGEVLQERLVARREDPQRKNWLIEWWNDTAYLSPRVPVLPYVSYFYCFRDDRRRRDPSQRAAAITTAVLDFKRQVDTGTLEPEYMKNLPLSMDQYEWMFNCCRIPGQPSDSVRKFSSRRCKHIVVLRRGRVFKVMHELDGRTLNTRELELQFRRIYADPSRRRAKPVPILTSTNRDEWFQARDDLLSASPAHRDILETIESASFVVCLDEAKPMTLSARAFGCWAGHAHNRWCDKPLQFIVNENGSAGFLGEHSMMDGTPTHRLCDYINQAMSSDRSDFSGPTVRSHLPEPQSMEFDVPAQLEVQIEEAFRQHSATLKAHQLAVQDYRSYGKGLIKQFKCSPDAYVQMIIQLAYRKMFGRNRPTYESAATRRFQQGRTETCRTLSDESVAFCDAMEDLNRDPSSCVGLFRKAIDAHVRYITLACDGRGVDRHLFGLKMLVEPDEEMPAIYTDPAYTYSSTWYLSTSQLSSEHFNGYGWSQVVDDGFGVAYMIKEDSLHFNIVSRGLGSEVLAYHVTLAADEIREILLTTLGPLQAKL